MEGRLFDRARTLDPESRIVGRRHGKSPQALRLAQRTADIGTVERLEIEASLGEQRRTVASGGLQGAANGLYPGSQRRSDDLTILDRHGSRIGLCPHVWYSLNLPSAAPGETARPSPQD